LSVGKTVEDKVSFSKLKKITNETLQSDAIKIAWKAVRDVVSLRLMGMYVSGQQLLYRSVCN